MAKWNELSWDQSSRCGSISTMSPACASVRLPIGVARDGAAAGLGDGVVAGEATGEVAGLAPGLGAAAGLAPTAGTAVGGGAWGAAGLAAGAVVGAGGGLVQALRSAPSAPAPPSWRSRRRDRLRTWLRPPGASDAPEA